MRLISENTAETVFDNPPYDLIYLDAGDEESLPLITRDELEVHNDTIIMIRGIYNNTDTVKRWNTLLQSGRFTLSIDLFYCGLLFYRMEQATQHFKIRI